jgi:regulatory LuxR family protein
VTRHTVKKHVSRIFDKLGAANRTEATLAPASSACSPSADEPARIQAPGF